MSFDRRLYSHNHLKGCWEHHLEWCPKYRYTALGKESIRKDCEAILLTIARERDWELLELAVMPDHVHVVIRTHRPENPSDLLFFLKGRSSYELFKLHPNMRLRYPKAHWWSRGSFSRTVGADLDVARNYVRQQADAYQKSLANFS